jgi:hypothetical protein
MIIGWLHVVIAAIAFGIGASYTYFWPGAKHDNKIEQTAGKVIKNQTGVDLDITPLDGPAIELQDTTDFKLTDDANKK